MPTSENECSKSLMCIELQMLGKMQVQDRWIPQTSTDPNQIMEDPESSEATSLE
jgi:hypothetical protein